MAYQEFSGELDKPTGFVEFSGQLDDATPPVNARKQPSPSIPTSDPMGSDIGASIMDAAQPAPADNRGLIQRLGEFLRPAPKSVMENYTPTAAETQAELDRRLSYGAGPISQQTAAAADKVRSSRGTVISRDRTVSKVAKAMDAQGVESFGAKVQRLKQQDPEALAEQATSDARKEFAQESPFLGALGSGSATALASVANIPAVAADFLNQSAVNPVLRTLGLPELERVPTMIGTEYLTKTASDYMPEIGKKSMESAWNRDEFAKWLGVKLSANSMPMMQSLAAALAPPLRAILLPSMGATAAGGSYVEGDDSRVAAAKGLVEIGTEMLPLKVFDKIGDVMRGMGPSKSSAVTALATQRLLQAGGVITANSLTGAIEESAAQLGGNALDKYFQGKDIELTKGMGEAAVLGAASGGAMSAPQVGAVATGAYEPQNQAARELSSLLESGQFSQSGIDDSVNYRVRTGSDTGYITPAATVANFTPSDSPTAQAGLAPIVVPNAPETTNVSSSYAPGDLAAGGSDVLGGIPGRSVDSAGLTPLVTPGSGVGLDAQQPGLSDAAAVPAGTGTTERPAAVGGIERLPNLAERATDSDLLSRVTAALPQPENNNADTRQPVEQWVGRKGDGYVTLADAEQALPGRQSRFQDLDWKVEQMPSGKYRLAGYATTQENANATQAPQAQQAAQEGSQAPAAATVAAPITAPSGKPFSTQQTAQVFAQQNGIVSYSAVQVDGGWALQPTEAANGVGLQDQGQGVAGQTTASAGVTGQAAPGVRNSDQRTVGFDQSGQPAGAAALGGVATDGTAPALKLALPAPAPVQQRAFTSLKASNRGDVVASTAPLRADQQAASALSRMMGKTATFFSVQTPGTVAPPNAFVTNGDTKNIFLDSNSDDAPTALVFHEGWHGLPPEKKKVISEQILPLFKQEMRAEFGREFGYDESQIDEEIPAFMAQSVSRRPEFMGQLKEKLKNKEFASAIGLMIDNMKNILTRANKTYGKGFSDKYISDVQKTVDILSTAYAEHMDSQGESVQTDGTGAITASERVRPISSQNQVASTLSDVTARWDAAGITNNIYENKGTITLSRIVVPKDQRGQGTGTKAMQALVDYADRTGQRIALSPSADFGGNKNRLKEFYRRFGFVENKGRNKDFAISETMIRDAQQKPSNLQDTTITASERAQPPIVNDFSQTLFKPQTDAERRQGFSNRFMNPVTLADGTRLSGFTDPVQQTTFHGYDKNGERITIRANTVSPEDIVFSKDSNRTADLVRQGLTNLQDSGFTASERSRIDMNFKDVIRRTPELQAAAEKIKSGEMTAAEYDRLVNESKPVEAYKTVPAPATSEQAIAALRKTNAEKEGTPTKDTYYGVPSRTLKAGDPVGLRLDIPSYSKTGTWVVTVHGPRKSMAAGGAGTRIGYESAAGATDVEFGISDKGAINIASGKEKTTIATMEGKWKPTTPAEAKVKADQALKSKDWAQVGMDPERHSYFYDRKTMEPIVSADEVIQIGPLVLAKNPVYGNKADFMFSNKSAMTEGQAPRKRTERVGDFDVRTMKDGTSIVYGDPEAIRAQIPEDVKGRVTKDGIVFTNSAAPRVRSALGGSKTAYSRGGTVLGTLPMRDGKYVGAPEKFNTPAKIPTLRKLLRQLADEGAPGRFWYENSGREVLKMVGGDVTEARKFVALLAIYSPQAKVDANSTFGLRAWAQYKAGQAISVKTGVMDTKAKSALDDVDAFWSGEKTGNFFFNLLREIDPSTEGKQGATIDMWMMRAGQYDNDAPTSTQYAFMENETNRLAAELGWEPQQVQAAIWVAMKARMENSGVKKRTEATSEKKGWIRYDYPLKNGKPFKTRVILDAQNHRDNWLKHSFNHDVTKDDTQQAKFDFGDGLKRHIGQVSFEARPGRTTGVLPGIHSAPYAQQVEFQQAVQKAFFDENGNDLLAMRLGLLVDNNVLAPGVWQGEISPSTQLGVAMAPAKGEEGKTNVDPAQAKALNIYAAVAGLVARQEGVGWHRPFYASTKRDANGLDIRVGRVLNPREAADLETAVGKWMIDNGHDKWQDSFAFISSPNGIRLVNFGIITNEKLHSDILRVAESVLPDSEAQWFASSGDMMTNNWKEKQNGQDYIDRASAEGRSDVLDWARDYLAPRVQRVFDDFSERYDWGDAGKLQFSNRPVGDGGREGGRGTESRQIQASERTVSQDEQRLTPLPGAPNVPGFHGPDPRLVSVAEQYARDKGITLRRQAEYVKVDPERATRIADAYAAMPHAPNDLRVKAAYKELIAQTVAQYRALEAAGYKFWFIDLNKADNADYASSPWNAMRDVRANQRMGVFPTDDGFGSGEFDPASNPLLEDTGIKWPSGSMYGPRKRVLANDLFRAVHDAFGHGLEGAGFRAEGEENAWQAHSRLFTGSALGAITSETRGQNSWLNYGPNGESNRNAKIEDTVFADQKTGLMPEWTWTEGRAGDQGFTASEKARPALTLLKPEDVIQPGTIAAVRAAVTKYKRPDGPDPLTKEQRLMGEVALKPLFEAARSNKPEFDRTLERIAEEVGGFAKTPGIKKSMRAVTKLVTEMEGDVSMMKDLLRGTIVVSSAQEAQDAINRIGQVYRFDRIKNRMGADLVVPDDIDFIVEDLPTGYQDILTNVVLDDGTVAEIQLTTPEMAAAKNLGHEVYAFEREMPKGPVKNRMIALQSRVYAEGRSVFDARVSQYANSLSNTSRDTSPALLRTSDGLRGLGSGVQAVAEDMSAGVVTGTSSQSKNRVPAGSDLKSNGISTSTDSITKPIGQGIQASNRQQPIQGQQFYLKGESRTDATRIALQDYFLRVKQVQDALTAQGGTVGEAQNVYLAEELSYGRLQEQLVDFKDQVVKPLIKQVKAADLELSDLALYAYARHAKERNAAMRSINARLRRGEGSGMTDDESDDIITAFRRDGKEADLQRLHGKLMDIVTTTRLVLLDEGLITRDEYDAWSNKYNDYVPLRGFSADEEDMVTGARVSSPRMGGRGFNIRGAESVRALGRTSRAGHIIENIVSDYERAVARAERNNVAKVFLDLATTNPDANLWEIDAERTSLSLNRQTGAVQANKLIDKGEDTISVKLDGKEVYIKIHDPLLVRALRQASKDETGQATRLLAKGLGWYTTLMRNTLTRFNPAFGFTNAVKDVGFGAVSALGDMGPKGAALFMKHYANPVQSGPMFEEFRAAGATTGGWHMRDAKELQKEIQTLMDWEGGSGVKAAAYKLGKGTLDALEFIGTASETQARFAAYKAARELGKSPAQAGSIAKNLTTNFNRKGEWGAAMNTLYLFFNAGVQGSAKMASNLKSPWVMGAMAGLTGLSAGLALYGASAGGDDDDGEAYWDKIPDFEKERNLIVMLPPGKGMMVKGENRVGTNGRYIKIPIQYGLNVFSTMGYQVAGLVRHAQDQTRGVKPSKAAINMTSVVFGAFNPMGGSVDVTNPIELGMAASPSIVDLGIQLGAGVNSFGRPVAPTKSPFDTKPDSENFSPNMAGTWEMRLARWMNAKTGGDAAVSGMVDVSPGTVRNVVRNATGGTGDFLSSVFVNIPSKLWSPDGELGPRDVPVLKAFYGEVDATVDMGMYYERRAEVLKAAENAARQQKLGIRVDYDAESRGLQSLGNAAKQFGEQMGKLRKAELAVAEDAEAAKPRYTEAERNKKRKDLQEARASLASQFNAIYYQMEKNLAAGKYEPKRSITSIRVEPRSDNAPAAPAAQGEKRQKLTVTEE